MFAASFISTRKVLSPAARLSDAPTRVKILSTTPDLRLLCRHERSDLRQQHDEPRLPQDDALSGHVRTRDHQDLVVRCRQFDIIGNERLALRQEPLHDGMASATDLDRRPSFTDGFT
jgi:hypothetical protein